MKKYLLIASLFFLFTFCKKDEPKICGCEDPATEINWLKDLIAEAETDITGRYKGTIYFEIIDNEPLFFVMMLLDTTNGTVKHWFKCNGEKLHFNSIGEEPRDMKFNHVIYTNIKIK
ncbi:MAG: hypothetical protein Q7W54_04275 [Bacteroidota bacterium]|nr:hypothetical protein [Bacteroidota bacterium]